MSDFNFSLIDAGDWSKSAEKLLDSISSAIGVVYEPTRIRRKTKAEADALIIKKKAKIKADNLESRAQNRLNTRELRRQKNIEAIVEQSVKQLPDSVNDKTVNEDWIHQFFNECQDVGNEEMQFIWSKILANEVAKPGSFSNKTLNVIKLLDAQEAKLFANICNYTWEYEGKKKPVHPPQPLEKSYKLEAAGLINIKNDLSGFGLHGSKEYKLKYFDETVHVSSIDEKEYLFLGVIGFTRTGKELLSIIDASKEEKYFNNVIDKFKNENFEIKLD